MYPAISQVDGPSASSEIGIKGQKFINFCSNNYLGLAGSEDIKNVVIENAKK